MSEKIIENKALVIAVKALIAASKQKLAITVNASITLLYWQVGKRIHQEILEHKRAQYGKQIIAILAQQLTLSYGKGWSEKNLRHCLRIAETFPEEQIVYALSRELSWTHLRGLMYIDDKLKRDFYIEMCKMEKWSTRALQARINSMLYERTAISKRPEKTIAADLKLAADKQAINPDLVFRDPYILDFLELNHSYSEKDLENAILAEMQHFIIELGNDFAFMARQKRIAIDNRDYYIDLLFYHRRLQCLVAIDLKIGEFEAGFKGQMELYLRYLEKHETLENEKAPIGLILCTGKNQEHIELLQLDKSNIKVAEYLTLLPPKKVLEEKLHRAIEIAKNKTLKDSNKN